MAVRGIVPTAMATVLAAAASFLVLMTPTIAVNPGLASRSLQKRAILTDVTYTSGTSFITISWGSGIFPEYSNMTLTLRGPGLSSPVIHVVPSPWYEGSKRFSGLMSGEQYTLSVLVDSLNQTTGSQNYTVPTKPEAPQAVVGSTVNTTFISLRWRPGSETAPDRYSVIYRNTRNPAHLTEVKTPEPTIIIRNLLPGRNYSIEVRAEKFGEVSNKAQVYMVTAPLPPTIVNLTAAGTQRLYLQWRPDPTSLQSNYDVFYTPSESGNTRPAPQCSGRTQLSCFIDVSETGKLPGHSYLVTVNARQGTVVSEQAVRYVNTKPEMPTVLKLEPIGPQSLSLAWEPNKLSIQNTFEVSYTVPGTERPKMIVRGCRLSAPYQCMVDMRQAKLLPGQMYRFTIIAISKGVRSAPAIAEAHTNPLKPAIVTLQATGTQTIRVEWKAAEKSLQSLFEVSYESANERSTRTVVRSCSSPEKPICTMDVSDADRLPGSAFIVAVTAVQFQSRSEPVRGQVNTVPLPATKLFIKERTTSSLVIAWPPPTRTIFSGFNISMSPEHGTIGGAAQINSSMWATVINGLQPGTPYRVQMVTLSGEARSQTIDLVFYTKPIAPSPPVMEITTVSSITIKWVPPSSGHYEKFRLRIVDAHSGRKPINTTSPQVVSKEDREVTFSNLFPGKLYVLMVETAVGIDIFSSPASSKMYTKPLPTTGIQLKEQTETHIAVTWEPAENSRFTGFEVRLHEVTGSVRRITAESPREVVFIDLRSGSAYTVEVVVKSGERRSDAVSRIFGTLPYPPQDVKVQTLANNSMTLTWNSRGQRDRFTVTVQTTQQGFFFRTWNVESDVTTLTVTGLSAGVAYTIKLLAVAGPYQSRPVILNSVASRPNSPHSLVITRKGTTTISFRWSAPANSGVDSYVIKIINMALAQVESERDTLTLTEQQFNGLRPGATYRIQVFAKKLNQLGTALEGQVTLDPNPAEDVNLKFVGKTSIQMEWKPPLDSDFDGYQLRYVTPSGGVAVSKTLSMEARSFEMVGLKAGTTYRITLQAVSRNQSSQAIEKLTTTLPASVATLELDGVGMTTVNMSWTEPENTGIDAYKLELTKAGESRGTTLQVKRGDPLMCTFRQLTPGATYNIRLTVIVNGRQSTPVVRDFTTKPMPVISIIAETIGASTIKLTWTVSLSGVQDTFKVTWRRHDLIQSLTEAATVVAVLGRNTFDAQIGGLLPGFRYQFFITSFSNNEASNPKAVNATTFPTAVNNVNAEAISSDSVRVTWNPPVESHYDHVLIEYRGTLRQSSRDWSRVQATESPAVLTGMFPGEMYQVKLTAVSADKLSGIRMTSVLTYPLPPSRVMIEKEETTMTSVKLTWVYDTATNYIIRWRIIYNIQELATEIIRNVDGAYTTEATIAGLQPGQTYSFRIYGVTLNDLTSQNYAMTNGTLKPICDTILKEDSDITNNETVAILYTENSGIHDRLRFTINTTPPYSIEKYATDEDRRVVFTRRGIKAGTSYTVTARALSQDEISSQFSTVKVDTVPNLPDFFGGNKAGGSGVEGGTQKQEGDKEGENKGEGQGDGSTGGDNQGTSGGTSGNQGGSTDNQGIGSGDQGSTDGGQGTNGGTGGSRDGDQESRGGTGGSSGGDQGSRGGTGGSAGGDRESSGGNGGSTGGNRDGSDGQGAVSTGGPGGSQGSDGSNHERNQGTGGDGQGSSRTRGGSQQGGGNRDGGQDGGGNTEKPGITTYSNKGDNDRRGGGDNQGGQDVTRETYISTTQSSVGGGSEGDNQNNRGNQGDGDQRSTDRGTTATNEGTQRGGEGRNQGNQGQTGGGQGSTDNSRSSTGDGKLNNVTTDDGRSHGRDGTNDGGKQDTGGDGSVINTTPTITDDNGGSGDEETSGRSEGSTGGSTGSNNHGEGQRPTGGTGSSTGDGGNGDNRGTTGGGQTPTGGTGGFTGGVSDGDNQGTTVGGKKQTGDTDGTTGGGTSGDNQGTTGDGQTPTGGTDRSVSGAGSDNRGTTSGGQRPTGGTNGSTGDGKGGDNRGTTGGGQRPTGGTDGSTGGGAGGNDRGGQPGVGPGAGGGVNERSPGSGGGKDERGDWPYNPTIIIIYLTHISGGADYFIIRCLDCPTNQTIRVGYTLNGTMEARFVDLEPDTTYRFSIVAVKGSKRSPPQTFTRKTQEAPPSAVNNLKYTYDDNYPFSLAITWEKPSVIKGVLRKYIVEYTGTYKGKENDSASLSLDVNQTSIMIRDLKAGFTYKFDVYGFTVVNGEVSSFTYKVPVLAPNMIMTPEEAAPAALESTETTITLQFVNPFDDLNGEVTGYTVLVSTDPSEPIPTFRTPSWFDVDAVGYQAIAPCKDFFTQGNKCGKESRRKRDVSSGGTETVNFTVGLEDCLDPKQQFCNGYLRPGKKYYIKLRAFSEDGQASDTEYSDGYETVAEPTTTRLYIPSTTTPLPETTNPNDVSTLKPAGDSQTTFQPVLPGDKTLPGVSDDKTTVRPVVSDDKSTLKPGVPDVKTTLRSGVSDDKSTLPPGMPLGKTTLQPGVSIGQPHTPIPSGTQQTGDVISLQPGVITGSTPNLQPSDATQHHIIPSDSSNEPQTTPDLDLGVTLDSINTTGLGGGAVPVKPSPEPDFDWTTTIIVICVILGIIFIGMLCLICYCLCKGDQAAKASKTANMTDLFKPAQKRGKRVETSIPVRIVDYEKYYMDLAAKSYFKFSEQFEDLKYVGRDQSCNAGIMPNNQQKNRFTNVLPYDFSRVMLMPRSDIEGSDYINASFIPGCNSKREYIATQGPLPQTRNDFWRMVWEQNAACIIMLTQCIEEGKDKSDYYWPQSKDEPRMYGSIQVQLARESPPRENKEWAVREFILYKGGLSRRTTMFHFTAWPDFSVPNNPQSLIRFIHRFRQDMTGQDGRPKVVMCSAGVGRTGVLLGLDILLQKLLKNEQIVDIYGLVHFMRQHRPMMVQTEQQYIFLHQCVLHILKQRDPNNATWDSFLDAKISTVPSVSDVPETNTIIGSYVNTITLTDDERPLSDSWS